MRDREYEQVQAALEKAQMELSEARSRLGEYQHLRRENQRLLDENARLQGVLEFIKRLFPEVPGLEREEDGYDKALRELLEEVERSGEVTLPVQPPPDQPRSRRASKITFKRVRKQND